MSRPVSKPTRRAMPPRQQRGRVVPSRRNRARIWIPVTLALIALVGGAWAFSRPDQASAIEGVQTFPGLEQLHQEGTINYPQTPPAGGAHNPRWQNCNVYQQPVGNENAVHSLEHGAVWITYRPDLDQAAVQRLQELTRSRGYILLSPYPDLPSPVVASAWGVQLALPDANDARLEQFLEQYVQGPQTPEAGAACFGGISATVQQ